MPITRDGLIKSLVKRKRHFLRKRAIAQVFHDADRPSVGFALENCEETQQLCCCKDCKRAWYVTSRCRQRVCPLCSYRVSKERAAYLKAMTKQMAFPKMLTLTMPLWHEAPRDGIKFLRQSFAKLRRTKLWKKVEGGAYQIELKRKPGAWHIHMHILFSGPYMPYQKLFSEWRAIIKTECPQIRIEAVTSEKAKEYVCKYTSKSADYEGNPEDIVAWYDATKGQRLFATFGRWYNVTIEELDDDGDVFIPKAVCPHCQAEKSMFFARDGPFIYGNEIWESIKNVWLSTGPELIAVPEIRLTIDAQLTIPMENEMEAAG